MSFVLEHRTRLAAPSAATPPRFQLSSLCSLPDPARRLLIRALPPATPLWPSASLRMEGEIKLRAWFPFTATQVLRAGQGIVWEPVVGGRLLRVTGADVLDTGVARVDFRLHGLVPVARSTGPDTYRSSIGRLAAETVVWLPQALAPQSGARWSPGDDDTAVVHLDVLGERVDVEVTVDSAGRLVSLALDRWGDPDGRGPGLHRFGGHIDDDLVTSERVRIAGAGAVGWHWGTEAWQRGEFFRFRIVEARHPA